MLNAACLLPRLCRLLLLLVAAMWLSACSDGVINTSRTFKTVVIDPGHGGHDRGATTRYGGMEKQAALEVSKRLRPKLEAAGFHTVMTRDHDVFIPLDERAHISNRQSNSIFISIHFNWARRVSAEGVEVFYRSRCSRSLASNILEQLDALPGTISRGVKTANFRVLKKNRFPAVLVECGFLSNPSEGRRCATSSYREALAEAIARGIIRQRYGHFGL